jgi:hypothetical protein
MTYEVWTSRGAARAYYYFTQWECEPPQMRVREDGMVCLSDGLAQPIASVADAADLCVTLGWAAREHWRLLGKQIERPSDAVVPVQVVRVKARKEPRP